MITHVALVTEALDILLERLKECGCELLGTEWAIYYFTYVTLKYFEDFP